MITTTCTGCGFDIAVPARRGHLVVGPGADLVVVACPTCRAPVTRQVDGRLRAALERLGVPVLTSPAQTPYPECLPNQDAPPFTVDDVISLHELLARPDWFAGLLAHDAA